MDGGKVKIFGVAGSLRKGSFNKMLLKAALEVAPQEVELEIFDLEGIPPFNQDLENYPHQKVTELKEKVKGADGILIVTPEYNYSVPGVLKNAIDAASRPYGTNPFEGKPVAIMGASIGMLGTARAQYHLRQIPGISQRLPPEPAGDHGTLRRKQVRWNRQTYRRNDEGNGKGTPG